MHRSTTLASSFAVFSAVGIGVIVFTASPATAQSPKPASDVRVVNASASPVPVSLQGTANVNVGTPTVNIGNSPTVDVSSLPAVQVDTSGGAVPVQVQNFPSSQSTPERVSFGGFVGLQGNQFNASGPVFTVPVGKRLVLEQVSFSITGEPSWDHSFNVGVVDSNGQPRTYHILPEGKFVTGPGSTTTRAQVTQEVRIVAESGNLTIGVQRNVNTGSENTTFNLLFSASGFLEDVPVPSP